MRIAGALGKSNADGAIGTHGAVVARRGARVQATGERKHAARDPRSHPLSVTEALLQDFDSRQSAQVLTRLPGVAFLLEHAEAQRALPVELDERDRRLRVEVLFLECEVRADRKSTRLNSSHLG